jgi:thiol-disulfide isomerase/thioredoxin
LNAFDIDGQKLDLRILKGKVAIVDLWGTWCPPCRQEIPNFVKLKETYGSSGLEIVGVNFERTARTRGDAIALVRNVRTQLGINYRCVLGNQTIALQVPDFGAFPTTLILDRNGQVRSKVVGYHSYEQLEELVKPLLGLDAGGP